MAGQNINQFDAFFKLADTDKDGKISGGEAVAFFQGSNLSKQVLAQIWTYADQARTGFLGRAEFYNALKLVTVAQTRRELTPDIVKAALYGPAAAKIPAPQIAVPGNQSNMTAAISTPTMGVFGQPAFQNVSFRGPGVQNTNMNAQYFPTQQSQSIRPPQVMAASRPPQGVGGSGVGMVGQTQVMPSGSPSFPLQARPAVQARPAAPGSPSFPLQAGPATPSRPGTPGINISNDWLGGRTSGASTGVGGISPSMPIPSVASPVQNQLPMTSQSGAIDSKPTVISTNGFSSDPFFGGNAFSAKTQGPTGPSYLASTSSLPGSSSVVPVSSGLQASAKPVSLDSLQGAFAMQPLDSQLPRVQSSVASGPQGLARSIPSSQSSVPSAGNASSVDSSQIPWPKMKPSDVQKYMKVFMEVDTDKDGKITGEQARNLFLSWRLPREVLKQVWDLSDQDNDSMLSLREFCFALYLMERHRAGCPLPAALPSSLMYDETLLSMIGQPKVSYGNSAWGGPNSGFGHPQVPGARPMTPSSGLRPPTPQSSADSVMASNQQNAGKAPVLDDSFGNKLDNGQQNSKFADNATAAEEKVDGSEYLILDSKEKLEFYRTKMQDLVLYKSRCDNRLNEITERALADKKEAESLGKKYEEKYKQVAEIQSKLTMEDATFREIQERKMELQQAITKMEQGGSADGILQVRADRIQSDLEQLMKVLTERCKKHGLEVKSTAVIELPPGWQPGIHENAAVWDEEWDKFEDEGFSNDLSIDLKNVSTSPKSRSANGSATPNSSSNAESGNVFSPEERAVESESAYAHSDDESSKSPQRSAIESPSQGSDVFAKSSDADAEMHRSFDESWGAAFDAPEDTDSVWGYNPSNSKDLDSEKHGDFFGSHDFGASPRKDSPTGESGFYKKSLFFEESIAVTSPRYSEAGDHFDSFSRFDSFSMHESGFSPKQDKFTRFDSVNSSKDFGSHNRFSSFDDTDPFGSTGPFKVSSSHQSPKKNTEHLNNF